MNKLSLLALMAIVMMGIAFVSCDSKNAGSSVKLKTEIDSISFTIGQIQGTGYRKQQAEPMVDSWPDKGNLDAVIAGFIHGMKNPDDSLHLGRNYMDAVNFLNAYFAKAQEIMAEESKAKAAESIAEAAKFLAENQGKSGVITTESGLQYKVIKEGKGAKPKPEDKVKIHYHGTLLDGTVFDSSVQRDQPYENIAAGFISGFTEGLLLMPVGSKYTLWIPVELGYYNDPNNQYYGKLLTFEVELLEIVKN